MGVSTFFFRRSLKSMVCYGTPSAILFPECDPFDIPSTSHWTGAVIIV